MTRSVANMEVATVSQCGGAAGSQLLRWLRPLRFSPKVEEIEMHRAQENSHQRKSKISRIDFSCLPIEIQLQIFQCLDVKDLCRASAVCREWYGVTSSNFLWRHRLDRDMCTWEVIGHLTQPNHHEVFSAPKKAYLRCSPCANQRALSAKGKRFRLPSLFKKAANIAMLGPGLESGATGMVQRIVTEETPAFHVSGLFPGVDGVGAGIGLKLNKAEVNLITLYHRTRAERRGLVEMRPSRIFDAATGFFNDRIQQLCKTLSGLVFLVDASMSFLNNEDGVEEAHQMLMAMLDARWTSRSTPFVMFAMRMNEQVEGENVRVPSLVEIAHKMKLSTLSRPWQLRYLDPEHFQETLGEGLEWLSSWN